MFGNVCRHRSGLSEANFRSIGFGALGCDECIVEAFGLRVDRRAAIFDIAFVSIVVATSGKCTSESTYHQSTNLFHFEFLYSFVYRLEILWLYDKESENAIQISDL